MNAAPVDSPKPFGQRVVEHGLATPAQVVTALKLQAQRAAAGDLKNLGEIMVEQGILSREQIRELLAERNQVILSCPHCRARYNVPSERAGSAMCPADSSLLKPTDEGIGVVATLPVSKHTPIGLELGGCRIIELLGRGGMGAVYKARHLGLARYVAMKLIPESKDDATFTRRLLFEAQAIAKLEHANIVQVYDVGCEKGYFFMVLQLLHGSTLQERIEELGPPPGAETLKLLLQIARGLEAAHRAGVVHRDLKPGNVFVSEDGVARLMDFGLARMGGAEDDLGKHIVGTPSYMAPEQWKRGAVDARTDLYALGVMMYEMITGKKPFEGKTTQDMMTAHLTLKPRAPKALDPTISDGVQAVVAKLMAKSPDRRYADASALAEDLDLLLRDEAPKALADTGRHVACGFCGAANSSSLTQCKVCGESLKGGNAPLEIGLRDGEIRCKGCGETNEKGARVCSGCRRLFCSKCGVIPVARQGPCPSCRRG